MNQPQPWDNKTKIEDKISIVKRPDMWVQHLFNLETRKTDDSFMVDNFSKN